MKGSIAMKMEIKKALYDAVITAINEMGIEEFKKTSLFLSNERGVAESKLAA